MNGKPIKQIAAELHISKQALWQRIKRHQQILDMLPEHSYMIKRSVFVDETLENFIKTFYNDVDVNTNVNNTNNVNGVDINIMTANLQKIIDLQQQQLAMKDKQIDELTTMLKQSQEQQTILVQALNAAQALAAIGKQQFFLQAAEQTTEQPENPEVPENTKKVFFQRIFRK